MLGIVLAAAGPSRAAPGIPSSRASVIQPEEIPAKEPLPKLNLGDCLRTAHEKQPKLVALCHASGRRTPVWPARIKRRSSSSLTGDHKIRKQQAATGVQAAQAEADQAEHDVTQAVVWTYYSVVYAREQRKVARDAVDFVEFYRDQVDKIVNDKDKKGGNREINQITLNRLVARLADGQRLHVRAQAGYERAKAALHEAMGVEPTYLFDVADEQLPDFAKLDIKEEDVVAHARSRRGEIIMASLASEVTRLEAYAQWSIKLRYRAETFASGADIHSRPLPSGSKDNDYRPDALGPEMPTHMFGSRATRSQKAWELVARSQAVLEKTRNLVTLEAQNAWIDYHFAGISMETAKKQADAGNKNLTLLREVAGDRVSTAATLQQLLEAQEEAAKGTAAYNEAVYQRITALANIERITAGGFCVKYPGR